MGPKSPALSIAEQALALQRLLTDPFNDGPQNLPGDDSVRASGDPITENLPALKGMAAMAPLVGLMSREGRPNTRAMREAKNAIWRHTSNLWGDPSLASSKEVLQKAARLQQIEAKAAAAAKAKQQEAARSRKIMRGDTNPWATSPAKRGFDEQELPVVNRVKVTFDDGTEHLDWIKGLNRGHAHHKAKDNWGAPFYEPPVSTKEGVRFPLKPDVSDPYADAPGFSGPSRARVETLGSFKYKPESVNEYQGSPAFQRRQSLWEMLRSPETEALRKKLKGPWPPEE